MQQAQDFNFDHLPPAYFPEDALAVSELPLARTSVKLPLVTVAPEQTVTRKALRIVRAKTGETEMRLLEQETEDEGIAYAVRTSTLNPYKHEDKVLTKKGGKLMNEAQARAAFDVLVTDRYPAVVLRNDRSVPVHLDLL
jgi:hypothetical protein